MIPGTVDDNDVPKVLLPVAGQDWPAIVDTGFNGDLELPESLRPRVNPRYLCRSYSLLAGGHAIVEEVYLVDVPFDGQIVEAEATFVPGGEILIGTHLLRPYRLEINFVARTVLLEHMA